MSDLVEKCQVCHAMLDEEDLFCANCGAEAEGHAQGERIEAQTSTHSFACEGCGASMSYDASAQALRCPFCGNEGLQRRDDVKMLRPRLVVPFAIDRQAAESVLRQWLGQGFWRPSDLATAAAIHKFTQVYIPYWIFRARTHTYWTADTSRTPARARANWYPLSGEHHGNYTGVLVGASNALRPSETSALCPFDLSQALPAEQVDLENTVYEQFVVQRKYARPLARQSLEQLEAEACRQYVPANCRNLHVNVKLTGLASEPVLLPMYIMAYRYRDQVFRFLVNGQTGRGTGQKPFSYQKLFMILGIAGAVIILILLLAMMAGAMR